MTNLLKKTMFGALLCAALAAGLPAQEVTALIVRQDGAKVYLDISELKAKPREGDSFKVTLYGEEIINPKTGKSLGRDALRAIDGRINTLQPLYAIGTLQSEENVKGLEAVIIAAPTEPPPAAGKEASGALKPIWTSGIIDGQAKAAALGDVSGGGQSQLILAFAEDNSINIFNLADGKLVKILQHKVSPLRAILSLDAADVKGAGKAQLFAVVYDNSSEKFNTLVFEHDGRELKQTDTIRGLVKGYSQGGGPRVLYTQDINAGAAKFALTTPKKLVYENGAFKPGAALKVDKLNTIFGINAADFKGSGKQDYIYTTPAGRLRVQFDKKDSFTESPAGMDFSTTPTRFKYKNDVQRLYLSLGLFKNAQDEIIVAAVENHAKLGLLADAFGSYGAARIFFLRWSGTGLAKQAQADIEGAVHDIAQGSLGGYAGIIAVPYTSAAKTTAVSIFKAD